MLDEISVPKVGKTMNSYVIKFKYLTEMIHVRV